ncbi:hypothetical protein BaRGS_00018672 [Batillaria attramentaria]|uniref:Apple domain-containing protein n=1 Tax=Batillaria attramentaria TaxID=370345 RepID=A0ABD0KTI6_9CAEN
MRTECTTLGSNFMEFPYRYLANHNQETSFSTPLDDCKDACLAATSYTCRTAEFRVDDYCLLSDETALTVDPADYRTATSSTNITSFQRTCLDKF